MVAELPTYGYRRVWALLRQQSERFALPVVNAKRVHRIMRTHHLLILSVSVHIKGACRLLKATGAGVQMASSSVATKVKSCG